MTAPLPLGDTPVAGFRPNFSIVVTWVYALLPANLVPTLIGGLVSELGVPLGTAGLIATVMTLGNAASVLATRPLVARGHRVLLARVGAAVLVLAYLVGALVSTPAAVITALIVGGIGSGVIIAAATAASARTVDPDRTTTTVIVTNRIVVALAFLALPLLGADLRGVLLLIAVVGVVSCIGATWLPRPPVSAPPAPSLPTGHRDSGVHRGAAWVLAIAFALWTISEEGTYALLQIFITTNIPSIDATAVSLLFAISIFTGLIGSLLSPVFLRLFGRSGSIAALLVLSIVAKLGLVVLTSEPVYFAASIVWGFAFGALIPLVFGLAALMTRNGSASVLVNGVYVVGVALGPLVATQVFEFSGQSAFAVVFAVIGSIAAVMVVIAVRRAALFADHPEVQTQDEKVAS